MSDTIELIDEIVRDDNNIELEEIRLWTRLAHDGTCLIAREYYIKRDATYLNEFTKTMEEISTGNPIKLSELNQEE